MLQHTHAGCMALKCCIPPTSSRLGQIQSFPPPCRSYPVALMTASVAQLMWGGSSSRGLACGTAVALCCPMMWRLRMLGRTTTSTRTPWTCCWSLPMRSTKWPLTSCPRISTGCSSGAQRATLGNWAWGSCSINGGAGSDAQVLTSSYRFFLEPRHFPRAPRGRPWVAWGREGARAHRALCGWLECQDAGMLQLGHRLHRVRRSHQARVLGMLRRDV